MSIIRYCLEHNPHSLVIFSTWNTFVNEELEGLQTHHRFYLIQSEPPKSSGFMNRHLQRFSTWYGICRAKALGATHVLKMRSDQLFRRPNICEFLGQKLEEFGPERFVIGQSITLLERRWCTFHIGDFWMFGKIENMAEWYDPSGIDTAEPYFQPERPIRNPESDFAELWMWRKQIRCSSMRELLARYFVLLDCGSVDLIPKFLPLTASEREILTFWRRYRPESVRHADWLKMLETHGKSDNSAAGH